MANQGDSSSTSTARFGLPIAALEVALPDDLVGTHVRTLIVEPLEDPVLAATSDAQPVLAATLISLPSWCSRW
jgi:hypothetical protein